MTRKIIYIQYTNPAAYPSLEHSSRILANLGWQVLFLGTGAWGTDALRFLPHPNISVKQLAFCREGWRQKLHYAWFCLWVIGWALWWRPEWVYASDPLSCPPAFLISVFGLKVAYHEHDSPDREAEQQDSVFMRVVLWTRKKLAKCAHLCVLPNQQRVKHFSSEMDGVKNVICVWNCPAIEEIPKKLPEKNLNELWLLYHGSIVPARLPISVLLGLAMLPSQVKLRIVGYQTVGHKNYVKELQERAGLLGIAERIQVIGSVPTRKELFDLCQQCDVGIAFMPKHTININEQNMTEASNKPFDYLACGLALLVSDLPDWKKMYVEPGYGLACDPEDPESIAEALRWFLEHPKEMRAMGEKGRQRIISEWNYERQFSPVFELLSRDERK